MSLGIAFKGPEGIVLAADSRVTLNAELQGDDTKVVLPSTFDNATKLLRVSRQDYVGVVTYGLGAIGLQEPRTAHSYIPEFEKHLNDLQSKGENARLPVERFAQEISTFFMRQWKQSMPAKFDGPDMLYLIGGINEDEPYGRVYRVAIPSHPEPEEQNPGQFGVSWGGQLEYTNRLIKGYDPRVPGLVQEFLDLTDEQKEALHKHLEGSLSSRIPYQFLPLQDCVDLSIFLIRTTIEIQDWLIGVRGVGGAIDVATITRTDGFNPIQMKEVVGQSRR